MNSWYRNRNIGILTFPISEAGNIPLSNLVDVLYPSSNYIYLITGNDGYEFFKDDKRIYTYGIRHESGTNVFTRILKYIYTQLKISYTLARLARNVDLWIFFFGDNLLLPMLTAKFLRKKVVLAFAGFTMQTLKSANDNLFRPMGILSTLKKQIEDLKIGDKLLFTGPLYDREKLKAYVDADVYVLPSVYEIFGIPVLEACACGTPVIVTNRCGIADVVNDKVGYVVEYDKDQLRDAMIKVLSDEGLRRRFGDGGRKLVGEEFGWEKVIMQVENVYKRTQNMEV